MAVNAVITIAGCGPGSPDYVTPVVRQAVRQADVLIGASRILALFADHGGEKIPVGADIEGALQAIEDRYRIRKVVVLVTGDPGLCSLAKPILKRFGHDQCRIIPGISAVQAAFAAVGLDWLDAWIIDAHGNRPALDAGMLEGKRKMAILLGNEAAVSWAVRLIEELGGEYRIILCEDLTLPEERVREIAFTEVLTGMDISSRGILLCVGAGLKPALYEKDENQL